MRFFRVPKLLRWNYRNAMWQGRESEVYLTFDDGPHPLVTPWVLKLLEKHEVVATFFCIGKNVDLNPELFQRIRQAGHAVGNHTMFHERGRHSSAAHYMESVIEAKKHIPSSLFRPPYGSLTFRQYRKLKNLGFKVVFWSWISYDFDQNCSKNEILKQAKRIKGGDILVFHDSEKAEIRLKEVLEDIIVELKRKDLKFSIMA